VQKMTEATLGQAKPIPGSHVEIPNPYGPGGIEGGLSILVGMLVELVSEGNATQAEAKLRFPLILVARCTRGSVRTIRS
jgi:hypothetical protein